VAGNATGMVYPHPIPTAAKARVRTDTFGGTSGCQFGTVQFVRTCDTPISPAVSPLEKGALPKCVDYGVTT
jgi:hypothetical protein